MRRTSSLRFYFALQIVAVVLVLGVVPTRCGCPNHYHVDVEASLTMQKVTLPAPHKHENKTTEELGMGHDPHVWLEGAEIARMPLAQLADLSWLPESYAGSGQWFHRCRPTCVFMSGAATRRTTPGTGCAATVESTTTKSSRTNMVDALMVYNSIKPAGPAWQQLKAVMEAVNAIMADFTPRAPRTACSPSGATRRVSSISGSGSGLGRRSFELQRSSEQAVSAEHPCFSSCCSSVPQRCRENTESSGGNEGVRVLEVRRWWPRGRWNWASVTRFTTRLGIIDNQRTPWFRRCCPRRRERARAFTVVAVMSTAVYPRSTKRRECGTTPNRGEAAEGSKVRVARGARRIQSAEGTPAAEISLGLARLTGASRGAYT